MAIFLYWVVFFSSELVAGSLEFLPKCPELVPGCLELASVP